MKFAVLLFLLFPFYSKGQNALTIVVKGSLHNEPLAGASVLIKALKRSAATDSTGILVLSNIPAGKNTMEISHVGYIEKEIEFEFKAAVSDRIEIILDISDDDLDKVTISSTRSNRSIANSPSRVEVLSGEEIREEAAMRPGDIKMLLSESTGIQAQQTSATTANAAIRIQGLDGRYTQILKDGFPIYAGAASGLGLLQTPPLDLKQVEILKGSSSTLYGGGAIAGLINLISKVPSERRELNFLFNITSAGGLDMNSFYGKRFKKAGLTLFVSRNTNKAFDPSNISFSAIPKFERYTVNPKLFLYFNDKTTLSFGINTAFENRLGGDMQVIRGQTDSIHSYFERNKTKRVSTQFSFDRTITGKANFKVKNSLSYFNRIISSKGYTFDGTQYSSFTEATYVLKKKAADWVAGINLLTDQFKESPLQQPGLRDYHQTTFGAFAQNTWNVSDLLTLESGLRADHVNNYGFALLPRVSALFKITPKLTSRIGGGLGYKPPTIFTEESEKLLYKNVLPINSSQNKLEKSLGMNGDVNYKTSFNKISFSINQYFFYTQLKYPLFLEQASNGSYTFQNIPGHIITNGAETNIKLSYEELSLYLGYTYTNTKIHNSGSIYENALTPKHRFNAALVYEIEDKWKFGSEAYHFSKQLLSDGNMGKDYWLTGLVAERTWKKFSLFINFENFGDVRQTKFESIYTGTETNPVFRDIYAPLEGFVVNGGIKLKL